MLRWGLLHIPGAPVAIRSDSFPAVPRQTKGKGPHRNGHSLRRQGDACGWDRLPGKETRLKRIFGQVGIPIPTKIESLMDSGI